MILLTLSVGMIAQNAPVVKTDYTFTGQKPDEPTELMYYGAR